MITHGILAELSWFVIQKEVESQKIILKEKYT